MSQRDLDDLNVRESEIFETLTATTTNRSSLNSNIIQTPALNSNSNADNGNVLPGANDNGRQAVGAVEDTLTPVSAGEFERGSSESHRTRQRLTRNRKPNPEYAAFFLYDRKSRETCNEFETGMHLAVLSEEKERRRVQRGDTISHPVTPARRSRKGRTKSSSRSRSRSRRGPLKDIPTNAGAESVVTGQLIGEGVPVHACNIDASVPRILRTEGSEHPAQHGVRVADLTPVRLDEASFSQGSKQRAYLPSQQKLVSSSVWWKWGDKSSKNFDKALYLAVTKEEGTDMRNGGKRSRGIDMQFFTPLLWSLLSFVYIRRRVKTRAKALVACLFQYLLEQYPELFRDELVHQSRKLMRKEVFQAWKFQRTIDLCATGGLNYSACDSIRSGVEELGKNKVGCIPCGTSVASTAKELESYAASKYSLEIKSSQSSHGPSYTFDLDIWIRLILDGYGLSGYAKTGSEAKPVILAHTLDGAQLTQQLGHVTAGIKIVDPRALDPITGVPLCLLQSRDLCFPCQITFGKDCKKLYEDCFSAFHQYFNGLFVIPSRLGLPELSNFKIVSPQDMSSIWKTTGLGGGCFSTTLFCFACVCDGGSMAVYKLGNKRCHICSNLDIERCFCHPVNDTHKLEELRQLLREYAVDALDAGYARLDSIRRRSVLLTDDLQVDRLENPLHLDFDPQDRSDRISFSKLIRSELEIRLSNRPGLLAAVLQGCLEDRRARLRELVEAENAIFLARSAVGRHDRANDIALRLAVGDTIPCVLHMEMRVGEKLHWTLFQQAMHRYPDGDAAKRNLLIAAITECMRTVILGDKAKGRVAQWTFPLKDDRKQVDPRSMTGTQSRKCVMGLKTLATLICSPQFDESSLNPQQTRLNNSRLELGWGQLADCYLPMMETLRQHDDFTDEEIDSVHRQTNSFMCLYVDLLDGECLTNYIHIIGAGHLHYYLTKYRNLYKFSQQGWEAMNQKLKHFHFNNTNHGGSYGNSNGSMITGEHVLPLMRMCLRFLLWKLGIGDMYFCNKEAGRGNELEEEMELEPPEPGYGYL